MKIRYTLNCQGCGCPFYSDVAFPEPQYCLECQGIFDKGKQEGRKEVVEWVKQYHGLDFEEAKAKLKEWDNEV